MGDVDVASAAVDGDGDGDGEVVQGGHDAWSVAGADAGGVLAEGGVADIVHTVFDAPVVALHSVGDEVRLGGECVEIADEIDDFDARSTFDGTSATHLDDLTDAAGDPSATIGAEGTAGANVLQRNDFNTLC